jgi:hypothetical protein
MEPEGILKAWTTKDRMMKARMKAMIRASAYSFKTVSQRGSMGRS